MSASTSPVGRLPSIRLSSLLWPVRAVAFWAAILLPFVSIGLVSQGHLSGWSTLGGLFAANVVALLLGHGYRR